MRRPERTAREVAALSKKKPGVHWVSRNLYLDTTEGMSWGFRYMAGGRSRVMGLGPYPRVTLAEARARADRAWKVVNTGGDPIDDRRDLRVAARLERARVITFRQCAEAYIRAQSPGWRNQKHAKQWPSTLGSYVYPVFGDLPVHAVDVGLVMKAIEPIWNDKPETASRVRGRIESVLDWATARGYRQGDNPARWRGHLDNLLPQKRKVRRVEHHAALPYAEIGTFMAELREQKGVAARALEFAVLTAARTGEVIGARWDEFDLTERLWVVPGGRMKAGKEHRVPLSDAAAAIIKELQRVREGHFVFPGGRAGQPLGNMAFFTLLRRMGHGGLTAHGFRSTFSDWCAEQTNFPAEVREMALAHAVGDKVEAAYRRGDLFAKRRQLATAWARFCASPPAGTNVVPLAAAGGGR